MISKTMLYTPAYNRMPVLKMQNIKFAGNQQEQSTEEQMAALFFKKMLFECRPQSNTFAILGVKRGLEDIKKTETLDMDKLISAFGNDNDDFASPEVQVANTFYNVFKDQDSTCLDKGMNNMHKGLMSIKAQYGAKTISISDLISEIKSQETDLLWKDCEF